MAIAVPWGPSMAINSPSMGIDKVLLTMIPPMGIEILDHKKSFDLAMFKISTKLSPFKFFSLIKLCLGFRLCPNISFGKEVIHSYPYYLSLWKAGFCWFSKEKTPNFLIQKRILRVKFLHISDIFSSNKQMIFSAMEAWFRRIFIRIIAILPGFSDFPEKNFQIFWYKYVFSESSFCIFKIFFLLTSRWFSQQWKLDSVAFSYV